MSAPTDVVQGSVIWFNDRRGYGFIRSDLHEADVYVHTTQVQTKGPIRPGDRVSFKLSSDDSGGSSGSLAAVAVRRTAKAPGKAPSAAPTRTPATAKPQSAEAVAAAAASASSSSSSSAAAASAAAAAPRKRGGRREVSASAAAAAAKRHPRRLQHKVEMLQLSVFTDEPFAGDTVTVLIVAPTVVMSQRCIASLSSQTTHEVALVQRRQQTAAAEAAAAAAAAEAEEEEQQQQQEEQEEGAAAETTTSSATSLFSIETWLRGKRVAASEHSCIASARAIWDRRLSGATKAAHQIELEDTSSIGGAAKRCWTACRVAARAKRRCMELLGHIDMEQLQSLDHKLHAEALGALSIDAAEAVQALDKVGSAAIVELGDVNQVKEMRRSSAALKVLADQLGVDVIVFTAREPPLEADKQRADDEDGGGEVCFHCRVFARAGAAAAAADDDDDATTMTTMMVESSDGGASIKMLVTRWWSSVSGGAKKLHGSDGRGALWSGSVVGNAVSLTASAVITARGVLTTIVTAKLQTQRV